jgi:hypothetical protein
MQEDRATNEDNTAEYEQVKEADSPGAVSGTEFVDNSAAELVLEEYKTQGSSRCPR